MERLIQSNSISISSKTILKCIPQLPRPAQLPTVPDKLSGFPFPPCSQTRRLNSISCVYQGLSSNSMNLPKKSADKNEYSKHDMPPPVNAPNGPSKEIQLVGKIVESSVKGQKVVATGAVLVLSALFATFVHPFVVSPAFASFKTAATGGSVAAAAGNRLIRNELLNSAWTGFFAGCLHTLSGPDHLAALAPLSIGRTCLESAAVGALWGCGHDAGQIIFGLFFLLLKGHLHIEILKTWGTRVVGCTLLVIGAMGIKEALDVPAPAPCVALENGECDVSVYEGIDNPTTGKKKIGFATFATGIVHGLQPDALMMILPALALPSRMAGAAFLCMFLVGTVLAMGSYTVLIGSCSQALKERVPRITEKLTWASSLVAIALGIFILLSEIFGFSLY